MASPASTSFRWSKRQEEERERFGRCARLEELAKEICREGREHATLEGQPVVLTFDEVLGWVECAVGRTRVLAQIDKVDPRSDVSSLEERLTIHSELPALPTTDADTKQGNDHVASIRSTVETILRQDMVVDEESLRVASSSRLLSPRVSLHLLSDEGSLVDCACLSAIIAIRYLSQLQQRATTRRKQEKTWRLQMSTRRIIIWLVAICAVVYMCLQFGKPFVKDTLEQMRKMEWARAEKQWKAEVFGKYEEVESVSQGYHGLVKKYKTRYGMPELGLAQGEIVAIKHLFPDSKKNFEDERDCLRTLRADPNPHPSVMITYEDYPTSFVSKFVQGKTLETLIKGKLGAPEAKLAAIFRQILEGTQHINDLGLYHGDLKPKNIFLGDNDAVTIVDFGDGALMSKRKNPKLFLEIDMTILGREGLARLLLGYEPSPSEFKAWHMKRDAHIQKGETFAIKGVSVEATDLLIYMCSPLIKGKSAKEALSFAWLKPGLSY